MVKYLTYLVLLVNLIVGLWIITHPAQKPEELKSIAPNKRLVLLSEITLTKPIDDEKTDAPPEVAVAELSSDVHSGDQQVDVKPKTVTNQENIATVAVQEKNATSSHITKICYTVGPFPNKTDAARLVKKLQYQKFATTYRAKSEKYLAGYRVYIPPLPNRAEALVVTRELQGLGVLDYFIINDERHKNGISLGLFKQKSGAIRRMANIRRFDYNVTMEARERDTIVYWVDVTDSDHSFTQQLWLEISEAESKIKRLAKKC